ncbi:MAG: hypothetical protein K5765_04385 [Clostridia bacterium]|nr:hypothetical protein [Clostridia bacterium]
MKTKKLLIVTLIIICLAIVLCACGGNNNNSGSGSGGSGSGSGSGTNDGFVKDKTVKEADIFTKFFTGILNVTKKVSKADINSRKTKQLGVDTTASIIVNNNEFDAYVKMQYKGLGEDDEIRANSKLEFQITNENKFVILGLYLYNNYLYVQVGENKIKFSFESVKWTDFFPVVYNSKELENNLILFSNTLANEVKIDSYSAKSRNSNGGKEYQLMLNIDIDETIEALFAKDSAIMNFFKDDPNAKQEILQLFAILFNTTEKKVEDGDIPDSVLKLELATKNEEIQTCKLTSNIRFEKKNDLFNTDELNVVVNVDKLLFSTNVSTIGLPIVSGTLENKTEESKFVSYKDAIFVADFPAKSGDNLDLERLFRVTFSIFKDNTIDDFLFIEFINPKDTNNPVLQSFYVYRDVMYIYQTNETTGEEECIYVLDSDEFVLADIAYDILINDLGTNVKKSLNIINLVAYIFSSFTLDSEMLKIGIKDSFFSDIFYNYESVMDFLGGIDNDFATNESVIAFFDSVKNTRVLFTVYYADNFIKTIDINDENLEATIEKLLNTYDPDNAETPEENGEDPEEEGDEGDNNDSEKVLDED